MSEYIEVGGRCKQALYLRKHRCIEVKGKGWRCKYCGTPMIKLIKDGGVRGEMLRDGNI